MADLLADRLAAVRRHLRRHIKANDPNYVTTATKTQVNAVIQAVVGRLDASRNQINSTMESAAPGAFTVPEKALIFAETVTEYALRELGKTRR